MRPLGMMSLPVQNELSFTFHWCEIKGEEARGVRKTQSAAEVDLPAVITLVCRCSVFILILTHRQLTCCHIRRDPYEFVVLFNSHSSAHRHMRFAKVLSQLHHSITTCRNTCTSVQQWSINNDNNNKNVSKAGFLCLFYGLNVMWLVLVMVLKLLST